MYAPAVLGGFDMTDDDSLNFTVVGYRGAVVASSAGWQSDATSRGGVITQVPGGFFHDIPAARFGSSSPYEYELPPIWLLVLDGVDVGTADFLSWVDYQGIIASDANQIQGVQNMIDNAKRAASQIPTILKWGAVGIVGIAVVYGLSQLPRRSSSD